MAETLSEDMDTMFVRFLATCGLWFGLESIQKPDLVWFIYQSILLFVQKKGGDTSSKTISVFVQSQDASPAKSFYIGTGWYELLHHHCSGSWLKWCRHCETNKSAFIKFSFCFTLALTSTTVSPIPPIRWCEVPTSGASFATGLVGFIRQTGGEYSARSGNFWGISNILVSIV